MLNIVNKKQEDIIFLNHIENIIKLDVNIAKFINATNKEFELSALLLSKASPAGDQSLSEKKRLDELKELRVNVDILLLSLEQGILMENTKSGQFNQQYISGLQKDYPNLPPPELPNEIQTALMLGTLSPEDVNCNNINSALFLNSWKFHS